MGFRSDTTYNTRNQSIIHSPDKPDAIQDTHLSPPARIGQNSAKSLSHPSNNGNISFKVIEETDAGGMVCRLSNIKSDQAGYRVTVDNSRGNHTDMKLEIPDGESLESVQEKLGEGGYRAKMLHNREGEPVCQLKENVGLQGGGDIDLPSWWPKGLFKNPSSDHYSTLSAMMKPGETVQIGWQRMTRQDCCLKALKLDPKSSMAYNSLGTSLKPGERVPVGRHRMTKQDCYLKAVELNPKCAVAYCNLATTLEPEKTVNVNGQRMTQQDCARKALTLEGLRDCINTGADDYNILGAALKPGETVQLEGQTMTKQDCYLKALKLDPKYASAYLNLATILEPEKTVNVNGQRMTQQACARKALTLGVENLFNLGATLLGAAHYNSLGTTLKPGEKVQLEGRTMTQQGCYLKALELNPESFNAYFNLITTLKPDETVEVGGRSMTQRDCYLKAQEKLRNGNTPAHIAARRGQNDAICTFHDLVGVAIHTPNKDGDTPVHYAAENGYSDTVRTLYNLGANINALNKRQKSPLQCAKEPAASILLELGAHKIPIACRAQNLYDGAYKLVTGLWGSSAAPAPSTASSSSTPPNPDQQPLELTPKIKQAIALVGDAININEANEQGGIKIVTQHQYNTIMNTCNKMEKLQERQDALCEEFEKIMGDTPRGLTKAQQDYFHAFLGAMQRFFIISNALSSRLFQTRFDINMPDTPIEMLGMAAEKTSEALAASLPVAGIAFKGAAWLIAQLLENKMINHLSPFSELFQSPNQCAAVAYSLANQLAREKGAEIQNAHIQDTPNSPTLIQRCKKTFEKYHLKIEEAGKVDKLAMQDVKTLAEYIYQLKHDEAIMTVNGMAYDYDKLQEAVRNNSNTRAQIINPMIKVIMGWSMQVPTHNAPQYTSQNARTYNPQNSDQAQRRDAGEPSAQLTQKELEELKREVKALREFRSNFQDKTSSSKSEALVIGRGKGQQQVQASAEESVRDDAYSTKTRVAPKEFFAYQELSNRTAEKVVITAEKVVRLEEAVYGSASIDEDSAPSVKSETDYDSGLDAEEEKYKTDANDLAYWIQDGDMDEVKLKIEDHPEAMHAPIKRKPGRQHIQSNALDIAARSGRVDIARLLIKKGVEPMRTMKRKHANAALKEAKAVAERNALFRS